jgi:hypothetical protein
MKFKLKLKNEKQGLYKRMTLFIMFINFIFFIYGATMTTDTEQKKWFVFGAVVILVTAVFNWYRNKRASDVQDAYSGNYVAIVFAWIILKNYWLAAAHLVLMILYIKANSDKIIHFTPAEIYLQGWPDKKIQWNSLSNVILKEGILTIDYKNNKLLQAKVVENWTKIEEEAFNQFCYDQINIKFYTPA